MTVRGIIIGFSLSSLFVTRALFADGPPCIVADIKGLDRETEQIVRDRLTGELDIPVHLSGATGQCLALRMVFSEGRVTIQLDATPSLRTVLPLDDIPPQHRARAAALSASGLLVRRNAAVEEIQAAVPPEPSASPNREVPAHAAPSASTPKDDHAGDSAATETIGPQAAPRKVSAALGFRLGARCMPKFPAWIGDLALGTQLFLGPVTLGISAVGLYGRRTVSLGPVHTTGGGLDLSVRWNALDRGRFHLNLGPAAEVLALYGFGRNSERAEAADLLAPAVTVRLLLEVGLDLSRRARLLFALSGGYPVAAITLQAGGKEVAGLSGGFLTLGLGVDFALL